MAKMCCGPTCACKVSAGAHMTVTGSGTPQDPFVLVADVGLVVADNTTFDLALTGAGTVASPWSLAVNYAATAKLDDLPDVNAATPTNGQVLSFNTASGKWVPAAPTTAASGSVQHDNSLSGDGSAGNVLAVLKDPAGLLASSASGLALSSSGINQLNRRFPDAVTRASASPAPTLDTYSVLDSQPGVQWYYDGAAWQLVDNPNGLTVVGGQLLAISGSYVAGMAAAFLVKQVAATTDGTGVFPVLSSSDLTGRSGVLSASFQETGGVAYAATLVPQTNRVDGTAFSNVTGQVLPGANVTGVVTALVY